MADRSLNAHELLSIEVAYASPREQWLVELKLLRGATVADAVAAARERIARLPDTIEGQVGIWGRKVAPDTALADGDRVEVYRPLQLDPMEARRRRAEASTIE